MSNPFHPWRTDPNLMALLHPDYPDDVDVMFFGARQMEIMWVRLNGFSTSGGAIMQYRGILLNEPVQFTTLKKGDPVHFRIVPDAPRPLVLMDGIEQPQIEELWKRLNAARVAAGLAPEMPQHRAKRKPWWKLWL